MLCPRCNGDTEVNRTVDIDFSIERNRRCMECGRYFNTVEITEHDYLEITKKTPSARG